MPDVKLPAHLRADAELLFAAVREAGELGRKLARQGVRHWEKSDGSTVTEADLQIDSLLKARLCNPRPDYGWLSEETPDSSGRLTKSHLWIADPIDGTNSFVNGTNGWCIGVALIMDQRPVLSALFRPDADEFFFAAEGQGAFCNDVALQPRTHTNLQGAELLGTNRAVRLLDQFGVKGRHAPHIPLLLRLAYVAAGRADIALSFGNKNDWDLAAGDLLVQESGAKLSDLNGDTFIYNKPDPWQNGMLAAAPNIHDAIMMQLEKSK